MIKTVDLSKELTEANLALIYAQAEAALGTITQDMRPDLSEHEFDTKTINLSKQLITKGPRHQGLKQTLEHYQQQLSSKQPLLHKICSQAAATLNHNRPSPKLIITIPAYETETRINNLLSAIAKQNFPKQDLSVYIFLNGPNPDIQKKRIDELKAEPELDVRVIYSRVPEWRWGLKSITTTTAMLSINASHDEDIAFCFMDADVMGFPHEDFLSERYAQINKGKVIDGGSYRADPYLLKEININAGLIVEIEQNNLAIKQNLEAEFNQALKRKPNDAPLRFLLLGGNSACSLMLLALAGGMPAHAKYFEDVALSSLMRSLLNQNFGSELSFKQFFELGLGPTREEAKSNYVLTDGGESLRALQKNYPLANAFLAHDPALKSPILTAIDWTKPTTINIKRIHEEIRDSIERFLRGFKTWTPELETVFNRYLSSFEVKINEILSPHTISLKLNNNEVAIQLGTGLLTAKQKFKSKS